MQIIQPSVKEIKQGEECFEDILKKIEVVGRVCYKSEDRIAPGSAEKFVNMLRSHSHGAMLEHGTIYMTVPGELHNTKEVQTLLHNKYTRVANDLESNTQYITTNYRVIVENDLENFMNKYIVYAPSQYHAIRRTLLMVCNRGVTHEFVRHRVFSFAQESQRYVNYQKDKFGNEIKVISPDVMSISEEKNPLAYAIWKLTCENAERAYMTLISNGATPQEARDVLPNATATQLVMTGFEDDWSGFFKLRCARDAHPQAQQVANMILEVFGENAKVFPQTLEP